MADASSTTWVSRSWTVAGENDLSRSSSQCPIADRRVCEGRSVGVALGGGDARLETWLADAEQTRGAMYVEVKRRVP